MSTKMLDLDALSPAAVAIEIRVNGEVHEMTEMTVEDFIFAESIARKVAVSESPEKMADAVHGVLSRMFPTVGMEVFRKMPFHKVWALMDYVESVAKDGAPVEEEEEGSSEGKVQKREESST